MFTKAASNHARSTIATVGRPVHSASPTTHRTVSIGAARMAAVLFCIIAAFHAALVLGAPWGEYTQGGGTTGTLGTSGRIIAAASCVLTIGMAGAILSRVGQGPLSRLPARGTTVLAWFTTAYAVIGVVLNLITRSAAERAVWAPVAILLLGLVTFVMVTSRDRSDRSPASSGSAERPVEGSSEMSRLDTQETREPS